MNPVVKSPFTSTPRLHDLADELLRHILGFLPFQDIVRCASTCRALRDVLKGSVGLQYAVELGINGLSAVNVSDSCLSTSDKLQLLRRRESAWNNKESVVVKNYQLSPEAKALCAYTTHGFLNFNEEPFHSPSWRSELVNVSGDPESGQPGLCRRWNWDTYHDDPSDVVVCLSVRADPSQDLLVVVNFRVHRNVGDHMFRLDLCSLSTPGTPQPHPLAARDRLFVHGDVVTGTADRRLVDSKVRICGPYLAFYGDMFTPVGHRVLRRWYLHIWNWQSEECSQKCVLGGYNETTLIADFIFLDHQRLLVLSSKGSLEVYSFADLARPPQLQRRYVLPFTKRDLGYLTLQSSETFPNAIPPRHSYPGYKCPLWIPNLEDQVLGIETANQTLFVAMRAILCPYADWKEERTNGLDGIPWSTWGPSNSRCFNLCYISLCSVYGSRVVLTQNDTPQLLLLDFNPWRIKRGGWNAITDPTTTELYDVDGLGKTVIITVETSLPYAVIDNIVDVFVDESTVGFFMDGEAVVMVRT